MDIKFSAQGTGACAICTKKNKCRILMKTEELLSKKVTAKNDDVMEIVIYRCPEFVESHK